jgi:hypothetical protein
VPAATRSSNKDAWKQALDRLSEHISTARVHPTGTLRKALVEYLASGGSTSGVEQAFSKSAWTFGSRRMKAFPETEEVCVKTCLDLPAHNPEEITKLARVAWATCFGQPRTSTKERVDKGVKRGPRRGHPDAAMTEIAFLRKRRREAAEAGTALESKGEGAALRHSGDEAWTEHHDRELAFQTTKEHSRKVQACFENTLLDHEVDDGLREEAKQCRSKLLLRDSKRRKAVQRLLLREKGLTSSEVFQAISGRLAFLVPSAFSVNAVMAAQAALAQRGLRQTASASAADVLVCHKPGELADPRLRLISGLRGCWEVSACFLTDGAGAALKIRAGALLKRALIVSRRCAASKPKFWRFLRAALPQGHKWQLHRVGVAQCQAAQSGYRPGVAWIVVLPSERRSPASGTQPFF